MDRWITALEQMVTLVLGNPSTPMEQGAIAGLSFLALVIVISRAGSAFGIPNTGMAHSIIVGVLGVAAGLLATVVATFYVPQWSNSELRIWILVGAVAIASVVVIVPLMCLLQKASYMAGLLTWLVSLGAAALVIFMLGAGINAFSAGERNAAKGGEHNAAVNEVLDQ